MGDGQRSPRGNLLAEIGDDRAVAAQDIPETGGDELGARRIAGAQLPKERLDVDLRDTLAGSHNIGGVDRLVGGDHDEALHIVFDRRIRHILGAQDIGLDGLVGETLHERHMLVGGGMIDDVGT